MTTRTDEELSKAYGDALEAYYPPGWPIDGTAQPTLLRAIYNLGRADQAAAVEVLKNTAANYKALFDELCGYVAQMCEHFGDKLDEVPCDAWRLRDHVIRTKAEADRLRSRVAELSEKLRALAFEATHAANQCLIADGVNVRVNPRGLAEMLQAAVRASGVQLSTTPLATLAASPGEAGEPAWQQAVDEQQKQHEARMAEIAEREREAPEFARNDEPPERGGEVCGACGGWGQTNAGLWCEHCDGSGTGQARGGAT